MRRFPSQRFTLILVVALVSGAACVRNPVTGKRQLSLISEKDEIALGKQAAAQTAQSVGLYDNPAVAKYVSDLGMEIARESERPGLPWKFQVLDDASPNAFALPGGFIFVTRGLLTHLNSEAELVGVLGHEVGHVTAKHSVSQLSKAQLAQLGLGVGMLVLPRMQQFGQLAGAGLSLLFLKHGRDAETQSDTLGFLYSLEQGYDAREMTDFLNTLARASQGQGRLPNFLATHPHPEDRIEHLQRLVQQTRQKRNVNFDALAVRRDEYMPKVDGMVFGENPRNGFFQGNAFYHPDMKFQFELPEGWQRANQPQAVVAVSPKQDALIAVAIAGKLSPEQTARQFFADPGVRSVGASLGTVEGLPAAASYFEAATEQGNVQGLVTFIAHEGQTFQLIGYTGPGLLRAYDSVFQKSLLSFGPLTDSNALNVKPARIDLVKLPASMTLQEFQQRYPSSISLRDLAIINGVTEGEPLPAGRVMKRVTGGIPTTGGSTS